MSHSCQFRVYYEDTDAGGVVYYANYLKFFERARTEMLRSVDIIQSRLSTEVGVFFVVRRAQLELHKPARLDDLLTITTTIEQMRGPRIIMKQQAKNNETTLAEVCVTIAAIDTQFKPVRVPAYIQERISPFVASSATEK